MNFIMQNNHVKKILYFIIPIIFWVGIWQLISIIVNNSYFLPSVTETLSSLFDLFASKSFYKAVISSLVSVLIGLVSGTILGIILAVSSYKSKILRSIVAPLISIIKSTPVATFIVILWVMLDGRLLPIIIAVMMVMPIIWHNIIDGFSSISTELSEVCFSYEIPINKKIRLLIFPALLKFFIPAIITASGLAWKAEIAAEIIGYTKHSIGQYINDAKTAFETSEVFAWTIIIIALSIMLEQAMKMLMRRFKS